MGVFIAWLCALCVLLPTARGEGLEAPTLRGTVGQLEDADLEVSQPRELQEKYVFPGKKLGSFSGTNEWETEWKCKLRGVCLRFCWCVGDTWALHIYRVSFRWIHRKPTFTMSYVLVKRHPVAAQTCETKKAAEDPRQAEYHLLSLVPWKQTFFWMWVLKMTTCIKNQPFWCGKSGISVSLHLCYFPWIPYTWKRILGCFRHLHRPEGFGGRPFCISSGAWLMYLGHFRGF